MRRARAAVRRRVAPLLLLPLGALSLASCSGDRPTLAVPTTPASTVEPAKVVTVDPRAVDLTTVATANTPTVAVYASPDDADPARTLANPVPSGGPLVMVVQQTVGDLHQVLLPVVPNGATGWVRASDVALSRHNFRIELQLTARRLDVFLQGRLLRPIPVRVGEGCVAMTPGRYYITELVRPATPHPVYGSYAYSLSGNNDTLEPFGAAPGERGIHGTGEAVTVDGSAGPSAGCVQLRNADIGELAGLLPLGVPVTVVG